MNQCLWVGALLLALAAPVAAEPIDTERAIAHAVGWLKKRQNKDGSFRGPFKKQYKTGETALCLLALLKGGVDAKDPRIERGFEWLLDQPMQTTYEVSITILALEALHTPKPHASAQESTPLSTQIRRGFKRNAQKRQRDFVRGACKWLVKRQTKDGVWAYPEKEADLSNSQFALLALKAGGRMGAAIPSRTYRRTLERLLAWQEEEGPVVKAFLVPAADHSIQGLADRRQGTRVRGQKTESSRRAMQARGWSYRPKHSKARASMTAAALAMLVICKSELEAKEGFAKHAGDTDRALRDGAAWLAKYFSVEWHPGVKKREWLLYWLYSLERAGSLLALERFGEHDWYAAGSRRVLSLQKDGRILHDTRWDCGDVASTCLGVLFLRRSTVPVVPRVVTQKVQRAVYVLPAEPREQKVKPGEEVELKLRWRGGPTPSAQRVFVHVTDAEGKTRFQADHQPPTPTLKWAGDLEYMRALRVPSNLAEGTYRVRVGLFDEKDYTRWPAIPLEGVRPDGELRYEVALFVVGKGRRKPAKKTKADLEREERLKASRGKREVVGAGVTLRASFCSKGDTLLALNDGALPTDSHDLTIPRFTWWGRKGTREWVELRFPKPVRLSRVQVFWFDDRPKGGCRVPARWSLMTPEGETWRPVKLDTGQAYSVARDQRSEVRFRAVKTQVLRLEVELAEGHSGGVLELVADAGEE
jgi:hypothetical protein